MKYAVLLFDDPAAWQNVSETEMATLRQAYMAVTEEPESYGGECRDEQSNGRSLKAASVGGWQRDLRGGKGWRLHGIGISTGSEFILFSSWGRRWARPRAGHGTSRL